MGQLSGGTGYPPQFIKSMAGGVSLNVRGRRIACIEEPTRLARESNFAARAHYFF
jgi:hypothetical protein